MSIRGDGILDPEGKYLNPLTGQPYTPLYRRLSMGVPAEDLKGWRDLEAWKNSMPILKAIHNNSILLLVLPTGVGKTVIIPKLLLHYFGYQKSVICTTPRQVTTSDNAVYSALCLDVPIFQVDEKGSPLSNPNKNGEFIPTGNKLVGYKYQGTGNKYADRTTKLLFTTDGSVKQMILNNDINLSQYAGILIDEVHERSVNIDVLMALVLDIIPRRPDFKVVIMSATIDEKIFTDYFERIGQKKNYGVFSLPEIPNTYNIDIIPSMKKVDSMKLVDEAYKKVNEILANPKTPPGNILVFVTSESETQKIKKMIERNMSAYPVNNKPYPVCFYAGISETQKAFITKKGTLATIAPTSEAPQGYARKVIIATNVVESSVTFKDPIVFVIETGLAFEVKYNPKDYYYESGKNPVSKASIIQRCGRTGRTNDGTCLRLYTTEQFDKLPKYPEPKIKTEDFTKELLSIINMPTVGNLQKAMEFINKMIEEPRNYKEYIVRAYNNLVNMDLIDKAGNLTHLGYICNQFGKYDMKMGKMIIGAYYLGCMPYAIMLGAILSSVMGLEDLFMKFPNMDEDPELQKKYDDNVRRMLNKHGDHITLLNIYYGFISSSNGYKYAIDNGLNVNNLNSIQTKHDEIIQLVEGKMEQFGNLGLFNVVGGVQTGGGNNNNNNIKSYTRVGKTAKDYENFQRMINQEGGFLFEDTAEEGDGDSGSESEDPSDDDSENEENLMEGGFVNMIREGFDEEISDDGDEEDDSDSDADDSYSETNMLETNNRFANDSRRQNISGNIFTNNSKTSFRNIKNISQYGGGANASYDFFSFQNHTLNPTLTKKYKQGQIINLSGGANKQSHKKKQTQHNKQIQLKKKTHQNKKSHHKKTKKHDTPKEDSMASKRLRFLEAIELKNLPIKKITPPTSLIDCILASLFYGYSINRASGTGNINRYNVQFSGKKGSLTKSTFDFLKTGSPPDFVVYDKFIVSKMGGKDEAKLNIVSSITPKHIGVFLDLKEVLKNI